MSSTNRGGKREVSDYYRTPPEHIRVFLVEFLDDIIEDGDEMAAPGRGIAVLDPCAGGDAEHLPAYPAVLEEWAGMFRPIRTLDIREDSPAAVHGDYLKTEIKGQYDIIITNPPFSHAQEVIEKALADVAPGGYVIMLLRLNFLGSEKRKGFFKKYPPFRIYVHSSRMDFLGGPKRKTDSIEYAHFVWKKGTAPEFAGLKVIDPE